MADYVMARKIDGNIVQFFPKTRSDLVMYDENKNITEKLQEIITSVQGITSRLDTLEAKVQSLETDVVKVSSD